jgi:3-oxoacyl-[acyl-carrier-protein] synthase-3
MSNSIYSVIKSTGRFIPSNRIKNETFLSNDFYENNGERINKTNQEIIDKFLEITTIAERRYVSKDQSTSDIAYLAALDALNSSDVDKEDLDYIIIAHNFGDIQDGTSQLDIVPSLAARVKYKLKIKNPNTVAYDLPFGCPGWLQGIIQADYFIKSGDAKRILVIGADILSRVSDPHDRDSMIYADGAGAVILEAKRSDTPIGILAHKTRSDTYKYSKMLYMGPSYKKENKKKGALYLKMNGRKLYQYALETVPNAIKECLKKSNTSIKEVKKFLIHQANGKMDDAILKRIYLLYGLQNMPNDIMPMTISWLGNSSVATIPTLLDLILKGDFNPHKIVKGDILVFASVGAGMNINAMTYKV